MGININIEYEINAVISTKWYQVMYILCVQFLQQHIKLYLVVQNEVNCWSELSDVSVRETVHQNSDRHVQQQSY